MKEITDIVNENKLSVSSVEGSYSYKLSFIEGEDCYVAFIDILGFKEYVLKNSITEVKKIFDDLLQVRESVFKLLGVKEFEEMQIHSYFQVMSDSIVIAVPTKYNNSLAFICECCRQIQAKLLHEQVLARGAITRGEFYGKNGIMFGKAFIQAYLMESGDAKYPRIILSAKLINDYLKRVGTSTIIYVTDFVIKSPDEYYFVNYFMIYITGDETARKLSGLIKQKISSESVSGSIRDKYLWLKDYFNKAVFDKSYNIDIDSKYEINENVTYGL